jgi:signal transduction histidine kinase/CheY-like chemotaxis protein
VKLRSQIFLFLLLLGLAPLLISVAINIPLVLDRLELFYHKAYLQKLRADFRDLDQHITRRQEMVRLFAKMPEPGMLPAASTGASKETLERNRKGYTEWANRVLFDQPDIIQVAFIRKNGDVVFSLTRDRETGILVADDWTVELPSEHFVAAGLKVGPGVVLTSPIRFNQDIIESEPQRFMTLSFISPLFAASSQGVMPEVQGAVIFNLDVGGLAHVYSGLYWVLDNGEYLSAGKRSGTRSTAFQDFPGLEEIFAKEELALWEDDGKQIFWLPLFPTEGEGPLWVGRSVDPSPIAEFLDTLELRVIGIVGGMLLVVFVIARIIAVRTERISSELTSGIARVLEKDQPVEFFWKRPEELRNLGEKLSRLSEKHARDARALRSHARELEESNRYKSEFLANVSHELRTPLNSILLLSKMLSNNREDLPEEPVRQARVIHEAGNDLRTLIDTILDLSRIEAGQVSLQMQPVRLHTLLENLVELMHAQFLEKGLKLQLRVDPEAPDTLVTDHDKLRQILVNFVSNALKFTERGQVTIDLSPNRGADGRSYPAAISVTDSGIGIPEDKQELIFEAFKQVDGSTSRRYGGTGLGLTISRELARLIGGRIELESRVGAGSTFRLFLPLTVDAGTTPAEEATTVSKRNAVPDTRQSDIPPADYTGSRVLVVDDDLRNLLALTPLLESWGIEVAAAGDGREALETLREDDGFDLVLMDLMMPAMDGYETIAAIRADLRLSALPVVALTARAADDDRQRAVRSGAHDFVSKPVDAAQLKAVLDHYLIRRPSSTAVSGGSGEK